MSKAPPGPEPYDDIDDHYRRASALDPSRPGEAVRHAVLAHARQLAAQRASSAAVTGRGRRGGPAWRRPALFGALAAAGVAGLMLAPVFMASRTRPAAPAPALGHRTAPAPRAAPPAGAAAPPGDAALQADRRDSRAAQSALARREAAAPAAPASPAPAQGAPQAAQGPPPQRMGLTDGVAAREAADRSARAASTAAADPAAALRRAAEGGDVGALERLLGASADIEARDGAGRTALMLATLQGQARAVMTLLAHGADPNAADARGLTPLQAARAADRADLVVALQDHGAR